MKKEEFKGFFDVPQEIPTGRSDKKKNYIATSSHTFISTLFEAGCFSLKFLKGKNAYKIISPTKFIQQEGENKTFLSKRNSIVEVTWYKEPNYPIKVHVFPVSTMREQPYYNVPKKIMHLPEDERINATREIQKRKHPFFCVMMYSGSSVLFWMDEYINLEKRHLALARNAKTGGKNRIKTKHTAWNREKGNFTNLSHLVVRTITRIKQYKKGKFDETRRSIECSYNS